MDPQLGNFLLLLLLLAVVGKSASWAVRAAIGLSKILGWTDFTVSFLIVTLVSILPETIISVLAATEGVPSLGLGTLLGSNVADLTFVFGMVALFAGSSLRVERAFLSKDYLFLAFLLLPLILGFHGYFSRLDGFILIAGSAVFFYQMLRETPKQKRRLNHELKMSALKGLVMLIGSLLVMGIAAHFTVVYATNIAEGFAVAPALVGLMVIALGTTLPELLFSIRAARKARSTLALGDILGTVIADATLVLGIIALIHPFSFNPRLIIVTGVFMLLAALFVLSLLRSGRALTREEGAFLLLFYLAFIIVEFVLRNWTPLIVG